MVGLWSFQERDTKLGRFLPSNEHIQRKFSSLFKNIFFFVEYVHFSGKIYLIIRIPSLQNLTTEYSHNTHIYGFLSLFFLCFNLLHIVVFNMVSIVLKISQHWFHEFFLIIVFEDLHWMDFVGESKFNCNFLLNRKTFLEKFHKYQKSSS